MRLLLRIFAILDIIALVFMGMQLWQIATHFNELPGKISAQISAVLMFPMFLLVLAGAIGLLCGKKWSYLLYYLQFPLRLYLWVFSIGFITLLPEALSLYDDKWFDTLLKICFVAEFMRLYFTIKAHLTLTKK